MAISHIKSLNNELLEEVFSFLSPKDLLRCAGVDSEWRTSANEFLSRTLVEPRGFRFPVYDREEFLGKFRERVEKIEPNQRLKVNVFLFRAFNGISTLEGLFVYRNWIPRNRNDIPSNEKIVVFNAMLNEVYKTEVFGRISASGCEEREAEEIVPMLRFSSRLSYGFQAYKHAEGHILFGDIPVKMSQIFKRRIPQLYKLQRENALYKLQLKNRTIMTVVAIATAFLIYQIFLNHSDSSNRDL